MHYIAHILFIKRLMSLLLYDLHFQSRYQKQFVTDSLILEMCFPLSNLVLCQPFYQALQKHQAMRYNNQNNLCNDVFVSRHGSLIKLT